MFSGWGRLQGCAAGQFGGFVYFCAAWGATKHNRWALCDIALDRSEERREGKSVGYSGNLGVGRRIKKKREDVQDVMQMSE